MFVEWFYFISDAFLLPFALIPATIYFTPLGGGSCMYFLSFSPLCSEVEYRLINHLPPFPVEGVLVRTHSVVTVSHVIIRLCFAF